MEEGGFRVGFGIRFGKITMKRTCECEIKKYKVEKQKNEGKKIFYKKVDFLVFHQH